MQDIGEFRAASGRGAERRESKNSAYNNIVWFLEMGTKK